MAVILWNVARFAETPGHAVFPVVIFVTMYCLAPRLLARPHVFSLLGSTLLLLILADYERGRKRFFWLLPPLLCLWAQLHGGFLVGLAFLFVFCRIQELLP